MPLVKQSNEVVDVQPEVLQPLPAIAAVAVYSPYPRFNPVIVTDAPPE
jgi:hypothetical protein